MLKDFIVNLSLLTTLLFLFSQMFRLKDFHIVKAFKTKLRIGITYGLLGIVMMFFSVRVNSSVLLDMRHLAILIAANLGGIGSALLTAVLISCGRILFFWGFNHASMTAILAMFLIAVGSGVIDWLVKGFWKRWSLSILFTSVVLSFALYNLVGNQFASIAPYYIGMIGFGGLFVMYLIHFLLKSNYITQHAQTIQQELNDILRLQKGLTFKFKKVKDRFVYTMGDGQLLYQMGLDPETMIGKAIDEVFSLDKVGAILPYYERAWNGQSISYESFLSRYTYFISLTPVKDRGVIKEVIATGVDITQLKRTEKFLQESEERFRLIASHSADLISKHLPDGTFSYLSPACYTILGYQPEEMIGKSPNELYHADDWRRVVESHLRAVKGPESVTIEYRFKKKNGEYIWLESTTNAIRDKKGLTLEIIAITRNITERKTLEKKLIAANEMLHRMSYTDGLTGIANRRYFDELLEQQIGKSEEVEQHLSIILLDIDDFKQFNDTYGHQEGDTCLVRVAETIQSVLDPLGILAVRYGGEEFAVLLPDTNERQAYELAEVMRSSVESLSIPHLGSKVGNIVTISLGVAHTYQIKHCVTVDVVALADQALYQAKHNGRNCVKLLTMQDAAKS